MVGGVGSGLTGITPAPTANCSPPIALNKYELPPLDDHSCDSEGDGYITNLGGGKLLAHAGRYSGTFPPGPSGNLKLEQGIYCLQRGMSIQGGWDISTDLNDNKSQADSLEQLYKQNTEIIAESLREIQRFQREFEAVKAKVAIGRSLEGLAGMMKSSITELQGMMGGEMGVSSTPGQGAEFWFTARLDGPRVLTLSRPKSRDNLRGQSLLALHQRRQQMLGRDLLVAVARRNLLRGLKGFLGFDGEFHVFVCGMRGRRCRLTGCRLAERRRLLAGVVSIESRRPHRS